MKASAWNLMHLAECTACAKPDEETHTQVPVQRFSRLLIQNYSSIRWKLKREQEKVHRASITCTETEVWGSQLCLDRTPSEWKSGVSACSNKLEARHLISFYTAIMVCVIDVQSVIGSPRWDADTNGLLLALNNLMNWMKLEHRPLFPVFKTWNH